MRSTGKTLTIKQNMIWNMAGSAIGLGCQWVVSILVVRLATDLTSAGLYSLAMSVYGIFSPIANFGLYTYLITDMEDKNTVGEYLTLVSFTSLAAVAITSVYGIATCRPNAWPVIAAYALYKGLAVVIDIMHAADQKAHRMDFIGISLALQGVICLVAFGVMFHISQNLVITILAMAACTLAIGVVYDLPRTNDLFPLSFGIHANKARIIASSCTLIVVSSIATGAFASFPRQALSTVLGDSALGIYASVATPVAIIQVGATYIYNPLIGYFAESFHTRNKRRFTSLLNTTLLGILVIGVLGLVGSELLGRPILNLLYGQEVSAHSNLLAPLVASSVLLGLASFLSNLLVAVRALRIMVLGSFVSLVLSVTTSMPLVELTGMNGATLSLLVACAGSILVSLAGIHLQAKTQFSQNN